MRFLEETPGHVRAQVVNLPDILDSATSPVFPVCHREPAQNPHSPGHLTATRHTLISPMNITDRTEAQIRDLLERAAGGRGELRTHPDPTGCLTLACLAV